MYLKQENQYSIFDEYDVALYNRIYSEYRKKYEC